MSRHLELAGAAALAALLVSPVFAQGHDGPPPGAGGPPPMSEEDQALSTSGAHG